MSEFSLTYLEYFSEYGDEYGEFFIVWRLVCHCLGLIKHFEEFNTIWAKVIFQVFPPLALNNALIWLKNSFDSLNYMLTPIHMHWRVTSFAELGKGVSF